MQAISVIQIGAILAAKVVLWMLRSLLLQRTPSSDGDAWPNWLIDGPSPLSRFLGGRPLISRPLPHCAAGAR